MAQPCRAAGGRAARPLSPRLPQPQSDAQRGRFVRHRFQDARMGPDTYDLASLLRDSYVDLAEDDSHALIDHFIALKREGSPAVATAEWERSFRARFEMMALQRNLKALGTFGYQ